MSANKYANLPDIVRSSSSFPLVPDQYPLQDTAPDIYETEDVFPSSRVDVSGV